MTVTYDATPGTKVILEAGSIQGIEVGEEEKLVIFGRGDTANGTAQTNDPTQVTSTGDAETKFGDDSHLTRELKKAIGNGANTSYLYGVATARQSVTDEAIAGGSGTLGNAPIVEDAAEITVTNTTAAVDETPVFRYDSPPSTGDVAADEVAINPLTGEVEAGDADDYEVDYKYEDWSTAFDSADMVLNEGESGVYIALSDTEPVASTLFSKATSLRDPDYKMVKAFAGAQPNANSSESSASVYALVS